MRRKIKFKELVSNNKQEIKQDLKLIEKIEIKIENKYAEAIQFQ